MRRTNTTLARLFIAWPLVLVVGGARAEETAPAPPPEPPTVAPAAAPAVPGTVSAPEKKFQVGVQFLPVVLGRVATGPAGNDSTYALERTYGFGIWASYRLLAGLSVGLAPQIILPLSAKDSAGYTIIDAEKEYDLLARLAYTQRTFSSLDVYAEVLPGYGFVTYDKITLGVNPPTARGLVLGAGLGAIYSLTDLWFVNAGVGYQMGFQVSHGISDREVRTRFLRIALGGGVRL